MFNASYNLYYCLIIIIFSFSLLSLSVINTIGIVDATTANNKENDDDNTKNEIETFKLKIKLNLNNVPPDIQKLKLVSYVWWNIV